MKIDQASAVREPVDVSVIIVNYNAGALLEECIRSLQSTKGQVECELILVDNASTDGSLKRVAGFQLHITIIANSANIGFSAAVNQGLKIATGRYVLLLNCDTIVLDRCLENVIAVADADADIGALGCRILNPDGTIQRSCRRFPNFINLMLLASGLPRLFPRSRYFARETLGGWSYQSRRDVDFVTGCFLLVRREVFEKVGLLDEEFFMYAEEADWCLRIRRAGWQVIFEPSGEIIHVGEVSSSPMMQQMIPQLWGSILLFIRRHHSGFHYRACTIAVGLFFATRIVSYFVIGLLPSKRRRHARMRAAIYTQAIARLFRRGAEGLCVQRPQFSRPVQNYVWNSRDCLVSGAAD